MAGRNEYNSNHLQINMAKLFLGKGNCLKKKLPVLFQEQANYPTKYNYSLPSSYGRDCLDKLGVLSVPFFGEESS